jgi:hypothetical protein
MKSAAFMVELSHRDREVCHISIEHHTLVQQGHCTPIDIHMWPFKSVAKPLREQNASMYK